MLGMKGLWTSWQSVWSWAVFSCFRGSWKTLSGLDGVELFMEMEREELLKCSSFPAPGCSAQWTDGVNSGEKSHVIFPHKSIDTTLTSRTGAGRGLPLMVFASCLFLQDSHPDRNISAISLIRHLFHLFCILLHPSPNKCLTKYVNFFFICIL